MRDQPLEKVQKQLANAFEKAALGYLSLGVRNFFAEQKQPSYVGYQATIGNLAIAVELMLKAYIARKNLLLLFKNLPTEIRLLLTAPESLPDSFNWRSFEIELRAASYQTIGLDECISLFYLFFPEQKRSLRPHLKLLANLRNASVHSILPDYQQAYEVNRVAYAALSVSASLKEDLLFVGSIDKRFPETIAFLHEFQEELIERVHTAIKSAKERAKKLSAKRQKGRQVSVDYWTQAVIECPVCGNLAILNGTTEKITWIRRGEEEINEPGLWFEPESFICSECGLSLDGYDEMKLGGIDLDSSDFDRTEDLEDFESGSYLSVSYFDE